jgi:hypothetical protein
MTTAFILDLLEQALDACWPDDDGALKHHADRGMQHGTIRYNERLGDAGIERVIGSWGYGNDKLLGAVQ